MHIHYEELVQDYWERLFNNLRNFKGGPAFLETWVLDEDLFRSLYGLFEAAEGSGEKSLSVTLREETAKGFDLAEAQRELEELGKVSIEKQDQHIQIGVNFNE